MPKAGQIIRAADFDGYASAEDSTDETNFNSTAYILGGTTVGVSFRAPTTGAVEINWSGRGLLNVAAAQRILLSAEVRTGASIGAGAVVSGAVDDGSIEWGQALNDRLNSSQTRLVTGLTPGATYNMSLWHRNGVSQAGAGTIFYRAVRVKPWLG